MVRLIVEVKDKEKAQDLGRYGTIVYASKYLNVIGMETQKQAINSLLQHPNVLRVDISRKGEFQ